MLVRGLSRHHLVVCVCAQEIWSGKEKDCRYLQQNRIRKIDDLARLPNLNTINISYNEIRSIDGISSCSLETLICTNNYLEDAASVEHLALCTNLQTIDLQNNKIHDVKVLDVFAEIPHLKCLYLKGNPVVSKVKQYRCCRNCQLSITCACTLRSIEF